MAVGRVVRVVGHPVAVVTRVSVRGNPPVMLRSVPEIPLRRGRGSVHGWVVHGPAHLGLVAVVEHVRVVRGVRVVRVGRLARRRLAGGGSGFLLLWFAGGGLDWLLPVR